MAKQRDLYEVLGVNRTANADQIRSAYRKLARQFHPDVNKAADAAKRFAEVQEAYDVLSDTEKRQNYDQFGHAGVGVGRAGGARGGRASWEPGDHRARSGWSNIDPGDFDAGDFSSIFEQIFSGAGQGGSPFGRAGRTSGTRQQRPPQQRGRDLEHTITVSFLTAALGGTEELRMGLDGSVTTISVKIPQGIESGAKLRIKGRGTPGLEGGQSGDLIITVEVGEHPLFRRQGLDLYVDVPVTIAEAVTGTVVTAPLISPGQQASINIKVPAGASSGRKLRVKGKGLKDASGALGDYYAVVQIVAPSPQDLSERGRNLVTDLAKELKNPRETPPWVDV